MRIKAVQIALSLTVLVSLCSYAIIGGNHPGAEPTEANPSKDQALLGALMTSIKRAHLDPKTVNDQFSQDVFDLYVKRLDFNKRFLLKSDHEELDGYREEVDNQIENGNYAFFDVSYEMFMRRVHEAKDYYSVVLENPFDFTIKEEYELDAEKRAVSTTKDELREQWRLLLKYQAMNRIHEMERKQEEASMDNDTLTILTFDQMEAKARAGLKKSNDRYFKRIEKWDRDDLKDVYLNSIMNVFGPHTAYFPPKDKENFDISMSGQLEGIGAQLQEKDGYIKVTRIVPGSASYRQGELEEGDLIVKVAQENEEPVDVTDMRLDDAVKLIRGKKGTKVILTVKKKTGSTKEIAITRDIVVLAETYAKSLILQNENNVKVGYIKLPKFYADFQKKGGRAAGKDVKKELEKLKSEGVDGVVLDLRGNGGGSLKDAIEITGHFIERGPVVQVKGSKFPARIEKDNNPTIVYDGPLVVMLNHFSASASEIVAAAIQDYDRGIILGTSSSFGKGTVQRFFDLDQNLMPDQQVHRPLGAVKITTQKFYRINGGATQLKGVEPDIVFPNQFNYIDMGEKEQEFVMEWDEIEPAEYSMWKPTYNESKVVAASAQRIASNDILKAIEENALQMKAERDETIVSLKWDEYAAKQHELDQREDYLEELNVEIVGLRIDNLADDNHIFEADSVKRDINIKWIQKLMKDNVLNEAIDVIADMQAG